jgi:hypothetical protein
LKRFIAIGLLLLYVNSNTELHEMMRVPVLFEHYSHHKQLVSDISFWEFLAMHYKTDVSHDADDNELPFKDPAHSFTASVIALPVIKLELIETKRITLVTHSVIYQETFIASHLSDIFQPPRLS